MGDETGDWIERGKAHDIGLVPPVELDRLQNAGRDEAKEKGGSFSRYYITSPPARENESGVLERYMYITLLLLHIHIHTHTKVIIDLMLELKQPSSISSLNHSVFSL